MPQHPPVQGTLFCYSVSLNICLVIQIYSLSIQRDLGDSGRESRFTASTSLPFSSETSIFLYFYKHSVKFTSQALKYIPFLPENMTEFPGPFHNASPRSTWKLPGSLIHSRCTNVHHCCPPPCLWNHTLKQSLSEFPKREWLNISLLLIFS